MKLRLLFRLSVLVVFAFLVTSQSGLACIYCNLAARPPIGILLVTEGSSPDKLAMVNRAAAELGTKPGGESIATACLDVATGPNSLSSAVDTLVARGNAEILVVPLVTTSYGPSMHDLAWRLDLVSCDDPTHGHDPGLAVTAPVPIAVAAGLDYHAVVSAYYKADLRRVPLAARMSLVVVTDGEARADAMPKVEADSQQYASDITSQGYTMRSVSTVMWTTGGSPEALTGAFARVHADGSRPIVLVRTLCPSTGLIASLAAASQASGLAPADYSVVGLGLGSSQELVDWVAWQVAETRLAELQ